MQRFGKLDVLCNVAGVLQFAHTHEVELKDWERILAEDDLPDLETHMRRYRFRPPPVLRILNALTPRRASSG